MRHVLAAVLCIALPLAMFAAENGYKVTYDGGSLPDAKAGTGMKIYIETNQVRFTKDKADVVTIPASAITEISYFPVQNSASGETHSRAKGDSPVLIR